MSGNDQQPERLEDQFRRMILTNATSQHHPRAPQSAQQHSLQPQAHHPSFAHQGKQPSLSTRPDPNARLQRDPGPRPPQSDQAAQNGRTHQTHGPLQAQAVFDLEGRQQIAMPGPMQPGVQPRTHQSSRNVAPRFNSPHARTLDPSGFHRTGPQGYAPLHQQNRQLFNPIATGPKQHGPAPHWKLKAANYLESMVNREVPLVEMSDEERGEKEAFRKTLETVCHQVCSSNPERLPIVNIECFGSFQSGFASAGSDMDLVIVVQDASPTAPCFSLLEDDLPRALEKRLLQGGHGARLLTRTRVPIIKVCEQPGECLLSKLREEREKWDLLPNDAKYPHLRLEGDEGPMELSMVQNPGGSEMVEATTDPGPSTAMKTGNDDLPTAVITETAYKDQHSIPAVAPVKEPGNASKRGDFPRQNQSWTRERKAGPLDFPKSGVGIQCDINFFNPLGLHNTQMLRCYSLCDPRVRPMVLFVKAWAKKRKINSSYSGTLSSYGYVLMVLHYLVNVVRPPVLPNLQMPWRPNARCTHPGVDGVTIDDWTVDFWRREDEIISSARAGLITSNRHSVGALLGGFFEYYSAKHYGSSFNWMQQVISLRTAGGLLSKEQKGWVKAVTEEGEGKRVQHRYLFCIEDPFELGHNVARTVTHPGIVAIRDEFRRANNILFALGNGMVSLDGDLFSPLVEGPTDNAAVDKSGQTSQKPILPSPKPAAPTPHKQQSLQAGKRNQVDVTNGEAFPALAAPVEKPKPKARARPRARPKASQQPKNDTFQYAAASGERAKSQRDEELERKEAERQAANTATVAAEAVLGD